ncbi:hypothetical protein PSHT_12461 [Puccinia striiformis]|uniref:Coatomer WD associated region domain-containing protein n=1 Tax=Puccinia striiformis TaxID=27350 RepID=A0A2S4UWF2_9BASI|nr:hypothetical protein PSHT_12461 [Puccinia striiformis]
MTRQTNDSLKFALSVAKSGDTQRAKNLTEPMRMLLTTHQTNESLKFALSVAKSGDT